MAGAWLNREKQSEKQIYYLYCFILSFYIEPLPYIIFQIPRSDRLLFLTGVCICSVSSNLAYAY